MDLSDDALRTAFQRYINDGSSGYYEERKQWAQGLLAEMNITSVVEMPQARRVAFLESLNSYRPGPEKGLYYKESTSIEDIVAEQKAFLKRFIEGDPEQSLRAESLRIGKAETYLSNILKGLIEGTLPSVLVADIRAGRRSLEEVNAALDERWAIIKKKRQLGAKKARETRTILNIQSKLAERDQRINIMHSLERIETKLDTLLDLLS